ncbi:uncharacterized protein LOC117106250 [Anneissia japonica]|uniref:uncharacterized protein LOC117106250 n=1 Tax=Anneissia japonica TaxID=1529436 RepID=UPI0014259156|nr:uncharacterized protein LOC117106250 [Anneissia japonica]
MEYNEIHQRNQIELEKLLKAAEPKQPKLTKKKKDVGRPPKHKQFPTIVEETRLFLQTNGFAAQERRRTETAMSTGVTMGDITNHLKKTVPGLNESEHAVRCLSMEKGGGSRKNLFYL